MASTWDDYADGWDDEPAARAYAAAVFRHLERLHDERRLCLDAARILDFGCGTGLLTERMAPRANRVVALDTSPAMISVLSRKLQRRGTRNVDLLARSIDTARKEEPSAFAEPFDLVVCSSVCAFVDDYPGTVAELVQVLRPGGRFAQWDWELDPASGDEVGLSRSRIQATLEAAGLADVTVETAFDIEHEGAHMRPVVGHGVR